MLKQLFYKREETLAVCPLQTHYRIICRCKASMGLKELTSGTSRSWRGVLMTVLKPTKIVTVIRALNFKDLFKIVSSGTVCGISVSATLCAGYFRGTNISE